METQFETPIWGITAMRHESAESGSARMFFNFLSSPPVIRLAEIFKWLFASRLGFALTISVAAAFLTVGLALVFFDFGAFLSADEAKHLHIIFALERGEVPYRDFLANDPALFHLFLLWLKSLFGLTDAGHVYLLSKAFVFLHIIACIALFTWLLCRFCGREFGAARRGFVFIIAFPLLGIWGADEFWQVRPDWVALFYAWLGAAAHLIMLQKIIHGQRFFGWLVLGAAGFGLSAAALSKIMYVIVPYALTLVLATVLAPRDWLKTLFGKSDDLLFINIVFIAFSALFFAGFVALELAGSNASLMDYIRANYDLNSISHPRHTNMDTNPFNTLRIIVGLPALLAYIFAMCIFLLFPAFHDRKKHFFKYLLVFIGLAILFNAWHPSLLNGALWVRNFIPSVAAAALYAALVIIYLLQCVGPAFYGGGSDAPERRLRVHRARAAIQLAVISFTLLYMAAASVHHVLERERSVNHNYIQRQHQRMAAGGEAFFAPDAFMPSDLKYLTFHPQEKPAAAPAWGYFFYSVNDKGFWGSAGKLGFAPDPAVHWRSLYEKSPPDALAVAGPEELKERVREARSGQGVALGWLLNRVPKDYACITRGRPLYVRNDLAQAYLRQGGWRLCDERN